MNTDSRKKSGKSDHTDDLYDFYRSLDRSIFINNEYRACSEMDTALPIGYGQTISQPSLVYMMTDSLRIDLSHSVLEIGTGSGYQTAMLAKFAGTVYTVERIKELSEGARKVLTGLGLDNIIYKISDGSLGWPEYAPFDRIMVTAAASVPPVPLLEQLKPGGRMIIPVGKPGLQILTLITKDRAGIINQEELSRVVFVELIGKYGFNPI